METLLEKSLTPVREIRQESIVYKSSLIEEAVDKVRSKIEEGFRENNEEITKLTEKICGNFEQVEQIEEQIDTEIRQNENAFREKIDSDVLEFKKLNSKMQKTAEDKTQELKTEVVKEKKIREDSDNFSINSISKDIDKMFDNINSQTCQREEQYENVIKNIGQEFNKCYKALETLAKEREELHQQFYKHIEEVQRNISSEITQEQIQRQVVEQTVVHLLEQTCQKVEKHLKVN